MSAPVAIATSDDRPAWLAARRRGVTATDMAKVGAGGGAATLRAVLADKRGEATWSGNASTGHGTEREPVIADWVERMSANRKFGSGALVRSNGLFAHPENDRHLATPDGLSEDWDFYRELVEIKTVTKDGWKTIPRSYLRQVWWQQYVLGAERTLVVWERHEDFVPMDLEPSHQWVKRDQGEIDSLLVFADRLQEYMAREAPLPPKDVDVSIARYLKLQERRDDLTSQLGEIETYLRNRAGGQPVTWLGSLGDLSIGAESISQRFSQKEFGVDHPDLVEQYKRPVTSKGRFTISPLKSETAAQENDAA